MRGYYYSNIVEVFLVLFTPIFMNKRFYWIVVIGTIMKYVVTALVFQRVDFVIPITLIIVFAIIAYIFIDRLLHYVDAIKGRYDEKIDEITIDATYKAVTSGTAILNHTIKNEALKIAMSANLLEAAVSQQQEGVSKYLQIINDSTDHMMEMVSRIHSQMKDIELIQQSHSLSSIINSALELNKIYIEAKNVTISKQFNKNLQVMCDETYIQEVLNNIIRNAIEALDYGGSLTVQSQRSFRYITIIVSDSGSGISSENLPYVMDPFFTTKDHHNNFGLGLAFCHNVMFKSGGSLQIQSQEKVGTKVLLNFPIL